MSKDEYDSIMDGVELGGCVSGVSMRAYGLRKRKKVRGQGRGMLPHR